jgi:hypothetical protein
MLQKSRLSHYITIDVDEPVIKRKRCTCTNSQGKDCKSFENPGTPGYCAHHHFLMPAATIPTRRLDRKIQSCIDEVIQQHSDDYKHVGWKDVTSIILQYAQQEFFEVGCTERVLRGANNSYYITDAPQERLTQETDWVAAVVPASSLHSDIRYQRVQISINPQDDMYIWKISVLPEQYKAFIVEEWKKGNTTEFHAQMELDTLRLNCMPVTWGEWYIIAPHYIDAMKQFEADDGYVQYLKQRADPSEHDRIRETYLRTYSQVDIIARVSKQEKQRILYFKNLTKLNIQTRITPVLS